MTLEPGPFVVLLVLLAVWMLRRTRADLELLGPLERMGDSKWRKSGPETRLALLDWLATPLALKDGQTLKEGHPIKEGLRA